MVLSFSSLNLNGEKAPRDHLAPYTRLLFALGGKVLCLTNFFKLFVSHLKGLLRRFVGKKRQEQMLGGVALGFLSLMTQVWGHKDLWVLDSDCCLLDESVTRNC